MRKVKEVLRLRFELGLGQRQIARCCGMGLGTVHEYLERAVAAGIGWPLPEGLGEEELEASLFGNQPVQAGAVRQRSQPDWNTMSSATATTSSSDPAVGVGRIPAGESRGVWLQLVLRALSALAAAPGCGAASRTQGRGKDVRGLGWGSARSHAVAESDWARPTSIWNGRWRPESVGRCRKAWAKRDWKPGCLATSPCRPERYDSGHNRIGIPSISNCNNIVI